MGKDSKEIAYGAHYTPRYQEICFNAWYTAGRPQTFDKMIAVMPEDENGNKPGRATLINWRDHNGWDVRADELDARAAAIVDDELVNARVLMLKEQAAKARDLQKMGIEHLRENGFDSASAAVSAIIKGAELERTSKGLSERIASLSKMDDEKLIGEANRLLTRLNIPTDAKDVDEIIDGESEEEDVE